MLSTDMCLAFNANIEAVGCRGRGCNEFAGRGEPLLAQDHNCCAWVETDFFYENDIFPADQEFDYCGTTFTPGLMGMGGPGPRGGGGGGNRPTCCERSRNGETASSFGDCDIINNPFPGGPAIDAIIEFMRDDNVWVASYVEAWGIATTNGL